MGIFSQSTSIGLEKRTVLNSQFADYARVEILTRNEEILDELLEIDFFQDLTAANLIMHLTLSAYINILTKMKMSNSSFKTLSEKDYRALIVDATNQVIKVDAKSFISTCKMLAEIICPGVLGSGKIEVIIGMMAQGFLTEHPDWLSEIQVNN
jgi:signal recognition particle GTPase